MSQRSRTTPVRSLPNPAAFVAPARRRRLSRRHRLPSGAASLSRHQPSDSRPFENRRDLRFAALVAAILGFATAMVVVGIVTRFRLVFGDARGSPFPIMAASLLAIAVGVRFPHRFAVSVCTAAWRRFVRRGTTSDLAGALIHHGLPDRALYWLVLSVIALFVGVTIALLPLSVSAGSGFYEWMVEHFLWAPAALSVLQSVTVFFSVILPFASLGLAIACAHHLCCRFAQWETNATAWVLAGSAVGSVVAAKALGFQASGGALMVGASLPVLIVSIGTALWGTSGRQLGQGAPELAPSALPLWRDRWPTLLRASIVAVGGGSACAMFVWSSGPWSDQHSGGTVPAFLLLALSLGLLSGGQVNRPERRSIGGFGAVCNAAGVVIAVGMAALSSSTNGTATLALACAGLASIGFATAYGRQALLIRVASRSSAGAIELGRLLVCAGLTLLVGAPLAVHFFGLAATLMMLAVSLVALGGTLVIHDPVGPSKSRQFRLGGLFVSMVAMLLISLMPASRSTEQEDTSSVGSTGIPAPKNTDEVPNGR